MEDKYEMALGAAKNKLARIEYTREAQNGKMETECYIGEMDYLREGYIGIDLPYDTQKKEMTCGGLGTSVDSVAITAITNDDKDVWLAAAIKHIEFCRSYDKWDRSLSFKGDAYERECEYIDGDADGRLKRAHSIELYIGDKLEA